MKGIIMAAGKGTRLYPITIPVCKPLLPVYDKPLIYYSLSILMLAGINEILIVVPENEIASFKNLLGDGSGLGLHIEYSEQHVQRGIADAFIIGEEFVGNDDICLVLGDNIFFGPSFRHLIRNTIKEFDGGAVIFGYYMTDPRNFGVVEFDEKWEVVSIEEKPTQPKSHYVIPGLYFYDNKAIDIAKEMKPSNRGEMEITSINNAYLENRQLRVVTLGEEYSWFDAGNADALYNAAGEIKSAQRSGKKIGCLEEIALQNHWITTEDVINIAKKMNQTQYGQYLMGVVDDYEE